LKGKMNFEGKGKKIVENGKCTGNVGGIIP
jgi:hypothetical protein